MQDSRCRVHCVVCGTSLSYRLAYRPSCLPTHSMPSPSSLSLPLIALSAPPPTATPTIQWRTSHQRAADHEHMALLNTWHLLRRRADLRRNGLLRGCLKVWTNAVSFARLAEAQNQLTAIWARDEQLNTMFRSLMLDAREILNADRATLFLVDAEENILLSKCALGTGEPIQVRCCTPRL